MGERKLSRVRNPANARLTPKISSLRSRDRPSRIGRGCREVGDFLDEGFLSEENQSLFCLSPAVVFRDDAGRGVALLVGVLRGADFLEPPIVLIGVLDDFFCAMIIGFDSSLLLASLCRVYR